MNYIIFDLESTCWENDRTKTREIIEIGAVKIDKNKIMVDEFSSFIKPILHPNLSEFCQSLTSIRQQDIDAAKTFPEVISDFSKWINMEEEYLLCSWGHYDKNQLKSDCRIHNQNSGWEESHTSLKHQFAKIKHLTRPIGMKGALKMEKILLKGTHHRGIDDARNIAKIFLKNFGEWNMQ